MDAELAALASSGATTLVGAMVSEAWAQVRDRVAGYFARRGGADPDAEPDAEAAAVAGELDAARDELTAARQQADAEAAADIEAEWRARLRRVLRSDPEAADRLRALLAEVEPLTAAAAPPAVHNEVHNSITGGTQHGPVIQAHTISAALTFPTAAGAQPRPADGETPA
ncbi:hypothetical protein VSR01_09955 [Actinacidiphila sp. DG2A-62]|uniref:hypothetical protein n=1 Tax=Actinacidiphila sp. DG2A-62 TaxID=3108821 RepID=UPI002DBE296C|nr:hypothetical protein [Actinacidiphila sp. DG2A-62]MEC3993847.1 hypothetical protein [Actinacidiphila sp. DG2A-62]